MSRVAEMPGRYDTHSFLAAFCAVALDLYPELDWANVEPNLQRSWERYLGDGIRGWAEVRDLVRARWEARPGPAISSAARAGRR